MVFKAGMFVKNLTSFTVMRIPGMQSLPSRLSGSMVIRGCCAVTVLLSRSSSQCYTPVVDRVEELEAAVSGLAAEDYRRFAEWFRALEQARWDEQMDRDSSSGKLDFLFAEAESEGVSEALRDWPPRQ